MCAARQKPARFREIRNARLQRDYFVDETYEAGIALTGTEVKSVRAGQVQLAESFVRIDKGRPILYHAHIAEYSYGNFQNHNPYRPRLLLLHKKEIRKLQQALQSGGGRTLIPAAMYFKNGLAKVRLALARGKKSYDKREDFKRKVHERETQRLVRHHL